MKRTIYILCAACLLVATSSGVANTVVVNSDSSHALTRQTPQAITREQVRAELVEAYRNRLLHANPNQYPSEHIEHAQRQQRTLAS